MQALALALDYGAAVEDVDPTAALNGAQIASILAVLDKVRLGELPPESAKSVIGASFPISGDDIERMLAPIISAIVVAPVAPTVPPKPEDALFGDET